MIDKIKFAAALVLLAAGVAGFYFLSEQALVVRILSVLVGLGMGAAVAWKTEPGARFVEFAHEAAAEAKKIVWPSRKETVQTTGAVFAFMVVMAVFLWLTDKGLEWLLYSVFLGWK